ncbi:flagellar basal body P-ring formation chaperone FlgA [Parendozoicomonas haliclonae]|uniref:Flagella basal body P-ring formation protein FlgA n=1 Tax=Parendozoicomonas haliclonae TaxID=1960125 RepID=A0A1X7ANI7_9GAMM|nr:flagellar basal body P-ring formation chaperone FlgA [Parendozoicomonas haliclonae]SMA49649.1 flagellar basal body P-ring biosynthesis protein FlgA [Parendozoicomonas haliclonae]
MSLRPVLAPFFVSCVLAFGQVALAESSPSQTEQEIRSAATRFLHNKARSLAKNLENSEWQASVQVPKSVERFSPCTADLTVEDSREEQAGRQRLKITCDGFRRWSVYVNGEIALKAPVLVMKTTLSAGDVVQRSDVSRQVRDITALRQGYLTRMDYLEGRTLRRRANSGDVLAPGMFEKAVVVRKGDRVSLMAGHAGLKVMVPGTLLEDGAVGDSVRIKNISSGKTLVGRVLNSTTVIMP